MLVTLPFVITSEMKFPDLEQRSCPCDYVVRGYKHPSCLDVCHCCYCKVIHEPIDKVHHVGVPFWRSFWLVVNKADVNLSLLIFLPLGHLDQLVFSRHPEDPGIPPVWLM